MTKISQLLSSDSQTFPVVQSSKDWTRILAQYRGAFMWRSIFELLITAIPFIVLCFISWWALRYSYALGLLLTIPTAGFLVRLFMIQHDCGHGAFFNNRAVNDWIGRIIGVLTLTPYEVWRRGHSMHHAAHGNLDERGVGDIHTATVKEYLAMNGWGRFWYRFYRHPVILFGFGPIYLFLFQNRLPIGFMHSGWKYWASAMGTNLALFIGAFLFIRLIGFVPFAVIYLPVTMLAGAAGIWLFYVQHQFENAHWDETNEWDLHDSALYGSTHYDLPAILRWMTGNIGVHHVHHLYSRIPFYRLPQVIEDHPILADMRRMTLMDSFSCARLRLWDENKRKLVSCRTLADAH